MSRATYKDGNPHKARPVKHHVTTEGWFYADNQGVDVYGMRPGNNQTAVRITWRQLRAAARREGVRLLRRHAHHPEAR